MKFGWYVSFQNNQRRRTLLYKSQKCPASTGGLASRQRNRFSHDTPHIRQPPQVYRSSLLLQTKYFIKDCHSILVYMEQFQYVFKVKKNVLISYKLTILISFSLMHHIHVWSCFFSTYDLREPDVPIHIVTLGDSLQDLTDSPSKTSYRAALGDVAASFDFGPPVELKRKNRFHSTLTSPDVVWPAYIVFGNGDVVIAYTDLSPDPSRLVFFGRFNWQCVCYCLSSLETFNVIICWTKLSKV